MKIANANNDNLYNKKNSENSYVWIPSITIIYLCTFFRFIGNISPHFLECSRMVLAIEMIFPLRIVIKAETKGIKPIYSKFRGPE